MTREEAIKELSYIADEMPSMECADWKEAISVAIKALEQESCDDAISRQAVLDAIMANCIWENEYNLTSSRIKKAVEDLPPVKQQEPKTGHWIRITDNAGHLVWECDKCGWQQRYNTNFCPDCGIRMESEGRNESI